MSEISAVVVSKDALYGELSAWVEGVGDVDIDEKDRITDGAVSGSFGKIVLVIRSPGWRRSHAALE